MATQEFTIELALEHQKDDLRLLKAVVTPEVFDTVKKKLDETNNLAKTGYDVFQRNQILNLVSLIMDNKRRRLYELKEQLQAVISDLIDKYPQLEGRIGEIVSISYDNLNVDTDIKDVGTAIAAIVELGENYKQNQLTR